MFELQLRDVVLRLSSHEIVWINLFRGRRKIHGRHVFGKFRIGDGKALSLLVWFIKSRYRFTVLDGTGSPTVAVALLAYTFLKK